MNQKEKRLDRIPERTCPLCRKKYTAPAAISRIDNTTLICPDCGTRQALESIGVSPDEQEDILRTIHTHV